MKRGDLVKALRSDGWEPGESWYYRKGDYILNFGKGYPNGVDLEKYKNDSEGWSHICIFAFCNLEYYDILNVINNGVGIRP